jgi:hypothetical protein
VKQSLVASATLLLFASCYYVPYPRSTYINPGFDFEGGGGVGVELPDSSGPQLSKKVPPVSARLSMNPSDVVGFDLTIYPPSLAVKGRAGEFNTMIFGETNMGSWHAGIAQGIPFTGREVVTLGLTAGEWPEYDVPPSGIFNRPSYTWWPLVLGSVSYHVRSSSLRITPSLFGGYYWGANGKPGT